MTEIADWMKTSCLKLNTDIMIFGKGTSLRDSSGWPTELGPTPTPSTHAKNLRIIINSKLDITAQVNAVAA